MALAYDLLLALRVVDAPTLTEELRALFAAYPVAFTAVYFTLAVALFIHFMP